MIGIIRVVTTEDDQILHQHGRMIEAQYGIKTISACIPDQPDGIYDEDSYNRAILKVVLLGQQLVDSGCQVLTISCMDDPGVSELRDQVKVPVIGAGSATAYLARAYGKPVGLLDIAAEPPKVMQEILGDMLACHEVPAGISTTREIMHSTGRKLAMESVRRMARCGVETIVFACTGYSTIRLAEEIRQEVGIHVIDPVEAEGLYAWHALHQKRIL